MNEIYVDTSERLSLVINSLGIKTDADGQVNVSLTEAGSTTPIFTSIAIKDGSTPGTYYFDVPQNLVKLEIVIKVVWSFTLKGIASQKTEILSVVTPYVYPYEFIEHNPSTTLTVPEITDLERTARAIVNAFTGQKFGQRKETVRLYPGSTGALEIRGAIVRVNSVTSYGNNNVGLIMPFSVVVPSLADTWEIKLERTNRASYYMVEAIFGYDFVPFEVALATRMLMGDMSCDDSVYRRRGIQAVRAADWRLDFHDIAFRGTGNVDVDLLLSEYRFRGMVII